MRSWKALQRVAAAVFVAVVLLVLAFSVGRVTAPVRHLTPTIAPATVSSPSPAGASSCRRGPC